MPISKFAKIIIGSAAVALFSTLLGIGISVTGVQSMALARLFFFVAWLVAVAGITVSDLVCSKPAKHVIVISVLAAIVFGTVIFGLDRYIVGVRAQQDAANKPPVLPPAFVTPTPLPAFALQKTPKPRPVPPVTQKSAGDNSPNSNIGKLDQKGQVNTVQQGNNNTSGPVNTGTQFNQNITGSGNLGIQAEQVNIGSVDRVWSPERYASFVAKLKKLDVGTASLVFHIPITDEMDHFGGQLQHAFGDAGWTLPAYKRDISDDHRRVSYGSGPNDTHRNTAEGFHCVGDSPLAYAIIKLLADAGTPCEISTSDLYPPPTKQETTIALFVGKDLSH